MQTILKQLTQRPFIFIALVFVGVNLLVWMQSGIVTNLEAAKYIRQGTLLYETGHLSAPKYFVYLPVILLVWCCKAIGLPLGIIAGIQIIIAGIALTAFYKLVKKFSGQNTALVGAVLLAGFIPLQQWNLFLFADSLFISFSILFSYLVAVQTQNERYGRVIIIIILFLFVFTRPHALLFIPPTVVFLFYSGKTNQRKLLLLIPGAVMLTGMILLANRIFTGGEDMNLMLPFIEEHIICFVPGFPGGNPSLDLTHTGSPLTQLLYYILHNPGHFLRLSVLKILNFFVLYRSYYSNLHNAYLLFLMVLVYLLAITGVNTLWKQTGVYKYYLFSLLIAYPIGATLQCNDWHSRFSMAMMPYICWSAAIGVKRIASWNSARSKSL